LGRIERFLASKWLIWVAVFLPLVLSAEVLGVGLMMDDYLHRAKLYDAFFPMGAETAVGQVFGGNSVFGLFRFMPGDPAANDELVRAGVLPWWSLPEVKGAFCRPVSALTHLFDYRFYPNQPFLHHLHSYLWAGLGVWVVFRLYVAHYGYGVVSGIAILGFALEDAHLIPTGWLANRNAWVALVFGALAILQYTKETRGSRWLGPLFCLLALFSGEIGLCTFAYIGAWEITAAQGRLVQRVKRLGPYLFVFMIWVLVYLSGDYGAHGSGLYIDPKSQPLAFAFAVPERIGLLVGAQAIQVPSDIWMLASGALRTIAGLMFLSLTAILLFVGRRFFFGSKLRRFWLLGSLLSFLPVAGVFPMDRVLMFAGIGFFALLGEATKFFGAVGTVQEKGSAWARRFVLLLLIAHIVAGAATLPMRVGPSFLVFTSSNTVGVAGFSDEQIEEEYIVVFNTIDVPHSFMSLARAYHGRPVPKASYALGNLLSDFELYRSSPTALQMRTKGGFLARDLDRMTRSSEFPFTVGYQRDAGLFEATVLEITADGRPALVEFEFGQELEAAPVHWVSFAEGRLGTQALPGLGKRVSVRAPSAKELLKLFLEPGAHIDLP